ncbi:MAG: chorismate-binding protein [Verrucomicrobiota bacterium]
MQPVDRTARSPLPSSFAWLRSGGGRSLYAEGPFRRSASPDASRPSFYVNDFELSDSRPWRIAERGLQEFPPLPAAGDVPELHWSEPDRRAFRQVFNALQRRIAEGELEKAVPVVAEWAEDAAGKGFEKALGAIRSRQPSFADYGFYEGDEGFLGASPEEFVTLEDGILESTALAGTCRPSEAERFELDPKEIREHELVAGYLTDKLGAFGPAVREPRTLVEVGGLVHFSSRICVKLLKDWDLDWLVQFLHPTPALGIFPRTQSALGELLAWRKRLGVPRRFGAPFGLLHQGRFESVVLIRGGFREQGRLAIPSGCGVIRESLVEKEWQELAAKRESVKGLLGFPLRSSLVETR